MDIKRLIIERKMIAILDPIYMKDTAESFYTRYGSSLEDVAIVAKSPSGFAYFDSEIVKKDKKFGDFYKKYAEMGLKLGINVYAVVNTLTDNDFGQDPMFKTFDTEGRGADHFVCPNREEYWEYIAEFSKELAEKGVYGIVLDGLSYIKRDFCACKKCRREFSEFSGIDDDFKYTDIESDEDVYKKWIEWRAEKINSFVKKVTESVWSVRKDVYIIPKVYVDMETNYLEGAKVDYGQDAGKLIDITGSIAVHINPWSLSLPDINSDRFRRLVERFQELEDYVSRGYSISLYTWGDLSENEFASIKKLFEMIKASSAFIYPSYPQEYRVWREAHLGIA
ncbi:MAG: hypothetical protein ACTSVF_00360 [Candidatus Asgardarchaeia archaeon]